MKNLKSYKIPHFCISILALVFLSSSAQIIYCQGLDHWETILSPGIACKYLIPDSELPQDWNSLEFNDAAWIDAIAGVGYGDGDDNTIDTVAFSVFLRIPFTLTEPAGIGQLLLDMDFDDGFVAYLNGSEIARFNLGQPGEETSFTQQPDTDNEARLYQGMDPLRFFIPDNFIDSLRTGENIFAVEVHNWLESSSDLSSNPYLHAGLLNSSSYFSPTPAWFDAPQADSSNLPIVMIQTSGQTIPVNERIIAAMKIIDNGNESLNYTFDEAGQYNGRISIEIRGASSTMFPKKSYSIETQTDIGTNFNVPLLGIPSENDWVLYAPYSDKTLIRNVLSYRLYDIFGSWSPRTRYVNLYLNDVYQGVYVLMERIKQDANRVNIMELNPQSTSEIAISGGYILQIDRVGDLAPEEYWTTPTIPPYAGSPRNRFEYFDPDYFELSQEQSTYIRNWMNSLDLYMKADYFDDPERGYRKYIHVGSFVDYFIFHELNKDVDAYRLSAFFYKRNALFGGLLYAGPPWDYNLTYGNMDYGGDIRETYGWLYTKSISMYWWKRLMEDDWFRNKVYCRWEELSETLGNPDYIHSLIDSYIAEMDVSINKNFERWPVIGTYVWPNFFIGNSYSEEVNFMKNWISDRIEFLNQEWSGLCVGTTVEATIEKPGYPIHIYPNPSAGDFVYANLPDIYSGKFKLRIVDLNGAILLSQEGITEGNSLIKLEGLEKLTSGVYAVIIELENGLFYNSRLLRL